MTRRRSPWDGEEMPESDDILQECIWIPAWICREGKISASIPKQYSAHSTVYCTVCASRGRFARHPNGNFPWEGEGDFAAFCASCRNHMPPSQSRGRPTFTKKSDYPDPPSLILFTRHRICVRYRQHMKALGGIEDFSDLMLAIHPFLFEHGRLAGVKEKKVDLAVRTKSYRVCVEI